MADKIQRAAFAEGWNVFDTDNGAVRVQRIDDPPAWPYWTEGDYEKPKFRSDDAALRFVKKQAKLGAPHAIRALLLTASEAA